MLKQVHKIESKCKTRKSRIFVSMSYEDKCLMREHRVLKNDSPKDKWT